MPISKMQSDSFASGVGGKVLQMVRAAAAPRLSSSVSSGTYVDSGVTASITPSSSSNKILIFNQINMNGTASTYHYNLIKRSIGGGSYAGITGANQYGNTFVYKAGSEWLTLSASLVDEPATTSAITYKIYYGVSNTSTWTFGWNSSGGNDNGNSSILIEIGS